MISHLLGADVIALKAGVELSEALDLTREWLSGLDQMEDDIEIDPSVLAELEERASAMRVELEGESHIICH